MRKVDIARPAVVRIITTIGGRLTVHFAPTSQSATFPLRGGSYSLKLSGSGAFISPNGDILTADHVVKPTHDQSLNEFLYEESANDIANYINQHYSVSQPYTKDDVIFELESGAFSSTPAYGSATSEVYLSTGYTGPQSASKLADVPSTMHVKVDRIEQESSFDKNDVAIVHVNNMNDMPSVQLGDSSGVQEQDNLTIIGFPGSGDVNDAPTDYLTSSVNKVYVSAIKKTSTGAPVIQVGGNVEHGNSGGPALDEQGNVVGIVSFGLDIPNTIGQTTFLQASNSAKALRGQSTCFTHYTTLSQTSPKALSRVACRSQQPATGKVKTVPHSSPGRFQFEPRCGVGPCEGGTFMPCGPEAAMVKLPEPVILQTIFTSVFASGGTPEVDIIRPHNSALVAVPCTSGPTEELSTGDAGWQFFRPGAIGPVIAGERTGVGFCAAGGEGVGELVEHAVNSVTSRKKQRERQLTK